MNTQNNFDDLEGPIIEEYCQNDSGYFTTEDE